MTHATLVQPQPYLIDNPNLQGGFAPVDREIVADRSEVIGEIPTDLNGLYVRNGPVPQHVRPGKYHWYDGDGMLHGVRFDRGRVVYRNRWVETEGLLGDRAQGENRWPGQ